MGCRPLPPLAGKGYRHARRAVSLQEHAHVHGTNAFLHAPHHAAGESEEDDEPDEPPTAAELALDALCVDIDRISLELRELQALSTAQLTPEQAADRQLDLLTGWHLVDGRERVIVVEGLAEGAMKIVKVRGGWGQDRQRAGRS